MTYESAMISFVIPSQVLSRVRAAQAIMNMAMVKYLDSYYEETTLRSESLQKRSLEFSASSYLFPSVYLAGKYPNLPESKFILSYVDPLPHNYANNEISQTMYANHNQVANQSYTWLNKIMTYLTSWSILATLVYVGSLPVLLQRCLVVLPLPFICSLVTGLILAFLRLSPYLYIPMTLLFVFCLVFGIYSISIFSYEWIKKLKSTQEENTRNQYQLEIMLDHTATQLDTSMNKSQSSALSIPPNSASYDGPNCALNCAVASNNFNLSEKSNLVNNASQNNSDDFNRRINGISSLSDTFDVSITNVAEGNLGNQCSDRVTKTLNDINEVNEDLNLNNRDSVNYSLGQDGHRMEITSS